MRNVEALQSSNQLAYSWATSTRIAHFLSRSGNDTSEGSVTRLAGVLAPLVLPTGCQLSLWSPVVNVCSLVNGPVNMVPVPA